LQRKFHTVASGAKYGVDYHCYADEPAAAHGCALALELPTPASGAAPGGDSDTLHRVMTAARVAHTCRKSLVLCFTDTADGARRHVECSFVAEL
jgi:tRNA splicing endonuclease